MSEPVKLRAHSQAHCKDCSLAPLCLPLSLNLEDMDALDEIVKRGRPLKKGEFLFRQGDKFDSVYAVRSGALKTFSLSDGGEEQITGFHLPSELVGLSGMDTEIHPVSAQALETTSVCEIPFERLDELAPHHIKVPSGSSVRLDYSEHPPILAVRLQELFGLADTPRIAGGRQVVKLHLLSPARRPVQVTQDLANFWRSTYAEVKKDLKGRYPKHYWPDDPLVAEATARIKPRKP